MKAAAGAAGRAAAPGDTGGGTGPVSARQTMRAIVQDTYGAAGVWRAEETGRPAIGDGEVLVRVRAAGLDRGTWHLMAGQPYLMRLMGSGLRAPKNRVPGLDVAGTVVAAGAAVTRFGAGDEVFGISRGSFADYACARADKLTHKPANLTFDQAAAVAVSGLTALQGLRDAGRVRPGQHVLITGASGGVGTFAVQIAKAGSPRSSARPTRCARHLTPCATSKPGTPGGSSSSR
jgi:NADPH:quinone reductase-like Zn-dependent oxidoreductase